MTAMAACSTRLGDLSAISNRNVSAPLTKGPRVAGESCGYSLLGIRFSTPNLEEATDNAMKSDGNAELLVDATISQRTAWFVIGMDCFVVEGTLARTSSGASGSSAPAAR